MPLVLSLGLLPTMAADVLSQWNGGTGDWTNSVNWTHTPATIGADYPHNDSLTYDAHITAGEASLAGEARIENLTMTGGSLTGIAVLVLHRGLHMSGSQIRLNLMRVLMRGTSVWEVAELEVADQRWIINEGVHELSDVAIDLVGPFSTLSNEVLLRKARGAGTATIRGAGQFINVNGGTVECASGTLAINVYSRVQGRIEAASGAQVRFGLTNGSSFFLQTTFSGGGLIVLENGPARLRATLTNEGTMLLNRTTLNGEENPTFVNESNGVLRLGFQSEIRADVINRGELRFEGPIATLGSGRTLFNYGLVELRDPVEWPASHYIRNYGEIQFVGSNTTYAIWVIENRGTIHATGGVLRLDGYGTNFGTLGTSSNGVIQWLAPHTIGAGSSLEGNIRAFGDTLVIATTTNHGALHFNQQLSGPGDLYFANGAKLMWEGDMIGPGKTILLPGATLDFPNGDARLSGRTIINESGNNMRWERSAYIWCHGGAIINRGRLDITAAIYIGPTTVHNEGTLRIAATNAVVTFHQLAFTNTGQVLVESATLDFGRYYSGGRYVQNSGQTIIKSGSMIGDYAMDILGGDFSVDGTNNCGLLRLDSRMTLAPGSVVNARQLVLTNTSVVEFELGPSGSGVINQSEWGWLNGTLRLRLKEGFMPPVGTRYTLLTHLATITYFRRHEGLEIGNGLRLVPHYTGNELEVVVMNAPRPGQKALTLTQIPLQPRYPGLSWPPEFAGFYLQHTTNLANPNWTTLFVTWTNSGNLFISTGEPQGFFRLLQP